MLNSGQCLSRKSLKGSNARRDTYRYVPTYIVDEGKELCPTFRVNYAINNSFTTASSTSALMLESNFALIKALKIKGVGFIKFTTTLLLFLKKIRNG